MMKIRPYRSSDAQAVSSLIRRTKRISDSADYSMDRLQPLIDYFSPEKVDALAQERTCFAAEAQSEVIGTGALEGDELVTIFVSPEQQGHGVASQLLDAVEQVARERRQRELRVGASLGGVPFYEQRGYLRTDEMLDGTAGAHVAMRKVLQRTTGSALA